jgi:hypothetical protein
MKALLIGLILLAGISLYAQDYLFGNYLNSCQIDMEIRKIIENELNNLKNKLKA